MVEVLVLLIKNKKISKNNYLYQSKDIEKINSLKKIIKSTKDKFKKIDCVINCSYPKRNQSKSLKRPKFK